MRISQKFAKNKLVVSIEIFPPKTEAGLVKIYELLGRFENYHPAFVSVTYGAGGSTRDRTIDVVKHIKSQFSYGVMPHFTCVGQTKSEIDEIIQIYEKLEIQNILALRGDPPIGSSQFEPTKGGFQYASELVKYLRKGNRFDIGCAGFPEGHIQSKSLEMDRTFLKQKIDAGADFIITQFFFCNEKFFAWRDSLKELGVSIPLVPGIWLPSNEEITFKFSKMNRVTVPNEVSDIYEKYQDPNDRLKACQEFTQKQVAELVKEGVPGLHIYSFNQELPVETLAEYFKFD